MKQRAFPGLAGHQEMSVINNQWARFFPVPGPSRQKRLVIKEPRTTGGGPNRCEVGFSRAHRANDRERRPRPIRPQIDPSNGILVARCHQKILPQTAHPVGQGKRYLARLGTALARRAILAMVTSHELS